MTGVCTPALCEHVRGGGCLAGVGLGTRPGALSRPPRRWLLLSFPGSTDDASERFFLQTRPVVSGLPPCLRGTLEGPGLPGDVRKGPSACWSRLCPTSHRQGDSDVLARAGGDVPELSAVGRCALRRVEPLSGTPRGPPWDVHSHGGPPRTPPPPRPSVLVLTIHALWL
uniref:Uncharacterized protein n=1 Tax=Rangifer tarandus platyrhynchus TaxID=3082113 RepID=A0ACB0EBR3_RANTA|nr:unnamed protein product [Rangifer tarandus platyrhynchus]